MGWDYKNEEEAIADHKAKALEIENDVFKTIEKVYLENEKEDEDDEELDTTDVWYKIISVDSGSFDAFEKLEELVNEYISSTTDTFLPLGPPQEIGGHIIQTLVDMDNLDNK